MYQKIIIIDFGSQYTQLIARRIRELNIYCEIHPYNKLPLLDSNIKGIILSGSPYSVNDKNALQIDLTKIQDNFPILGICYGAQLLAKTGRGEVAKSETREYGRANIKTIKNSVDLFQGMSDNSQVWMSHADTIEKLPENAELIASTSSVKIAAYKFIGKPVYGIQFHPEVTHSTEGMKLLKNFAVKICRCSQNWTPLSFVTQTIEHLMNELNDDKVILGLSGGVDSTVAATMIHKAIGKNLHCIFVDNGLLRKNEFESVMHAYKGIGLNVIGVRAQEKFLNKLKGQKDPEKKRKIIGKLFIDVFEEEAQKIKNVKWLAQGTIYPDVIESVSVHGPSATIKSHHNVGGLPKKMNLKVVEPLKMLFKDEVRKAGETLGVNKNILNRHPFPGPGLAIRILGDVTPEKVHILQEVDHIFIEGLKKYNLYDKIWQAGAIFIPVNSVGVMGDERTYENVIGLRAVVSKDGMTADWYPLPYDFLGKISNEIINNVKGINRVVYDISSKPPATIEWE